MTRTLVVTNHKGVRKTTFTANIAFGLVHVLCSAGAVNPRMLLVDTDNQGHATLVTTGSKDYGTHHSLYAVLTEKCKDVLRSLTECIRPSRWNTDLYVLPAITLLENA
jgi:cellulose biosynthesis protein BcsQ